MTGVELSLGIFGQCKVTSLMTILNRPPGWTNKQKRVLIFTRLISTMLIVWLIMVIQLRPVVSLKWRLKK